MLADVVYLGMKGKEMQAAKLLGEDIRILVLAKMLEQGVKYEYIENAKGIKWPVKPEIIGTSMKVKKGEKDNILTVIIYLSPEKESVPYGGGNVCPLASLGCAGACLGVNSARLRMSSGFNSKLWKTLLWLYRPDIFKALLFRDLNNLRNRAKTKGMKAACRLNGTSDILWELHMPEMFTEFPDISFYDYTKIEARFIRELPANYDLTFSRSEINHDAVMRLLERKINVAVVFSNLQNAIQSGFHGYPVFNADETDYRPGDPIGIAGLSIKAFVKDSTGFIINNGPIPKRKRKAA